MKSSYKNLIFYFTAPIIAVIVLLCVYYIKGIYPFGSDTVILLDLGQAEFPYYVHIYDALHGDASFFYDMTSAGGIVYNTVGKLFDPFMWLLFFVKRSFLGSFLSYFVIIKFAVIALSASYALKKLFGSVPWYWITAFSLTYTFCGYNLEYYTNNDWLTIVAVFPLIALATVRMLEGGKAYLFVALIAFSLAVCTYVSAFVLLFLVISCVLYLWLVAEKPLRRIGAFKLGMGTLCAVLLSAFSTVPWAYSTFTSQRYNGAESTSLLTTYLASVKASSTLNANKLFLFIGLEITVVLFCLLLSKIRKDKKNISFFLITIVLLVLQIAVESINLILHGGSYAMFPVRNGFMLPFVIVCAAAYYIEKYDCKRNGKYKIRIVNLIVPAASVFLFIAVVLPQVMLFVKMLTSYGIANCSSLPLIRQSVFYSATVVMLSTIILFLVIQINKNKAVRNTLCIALSLSLIFMNVYSFIGAADKYEKKRSSVTYIEDSFNLRDSLESEDVFSRVNNEDLSLNTNYPYLISRSSLSNWRHLITREQRNDIKNLGFSLVYTRVLDTGGTLFTKGLMRIDNTVSKRTLPDELYELVSVCGEYNIYNDIYTMPLGVTTDNTAFDIAFSENTFEYQNDFYNSMGYDGDLFTKSNAQLTDFAYKTDENEKLKTYTYTYSLNVGEKNELYFILEDGEDVINRSFVIGTCSIKVNGKSVIIPDTDNSNNKLYRASYNNNVLDLGTFENEDVTVEITANQEIKDTITFYNLSLEKMEELSSMTTCVSEYSSDLQKNTVDITFDNGKSDKYLFLPLQNSDGWQCTVNGSEIEIRDVLGSFMAIELQDGVNSIHLEYHDKVAEISIAVSVGVGVIIAALWLAFRKKNFDFKVLYSTAYFLLLTVFAMILAVAYAVPIGYYIYTLFI